MTNRSSPEFEFFLPQWAEAQLSTFFRQIGLGNSMNVRGIGVTMNFASLLDRSLMLSSPPAGSVNVRVGKTVEGPGGRWVPCATEIASGVYCSGLFEVGPGRKQVCAANIPLPCADDALLRAIELASSAAA